MKRSSAPATLVMVLATVFVPGILASARADDHRACSSVGLQGSFGFTSVGTLLALPPGFNGPFGEIGRQTFDGRGNTDGTATLSANGNIMKVAWVGSYVVSPDCTGSMTITIAPFNTTATLDFVINDDGDELRAIVTSTGAIETRVYRRQFTRGPKKD